MEKILKTDCRSFDITKGITIEDFNEKYNQIIWHLKNKYGYITNIKIYVEYGTYNDGEDYYEEISIKYERYETDEEFERRKYLHESMAIRQKENDLKKLKEYIEKYPEIATKYMDEIINKKNI